MSGIRVTFDAQEAYALRTDLGRQGPKVRARVEATMARSGLAIKKAMQAQAGGSTRLRGIKASIGYELLERTPDSVVVEVGPERGRAQGSLAGVAYEGTATSGPRFPNPQPLAEPQAAVLERFLGEALNL